MGVGVCLGGEFRRPVLGVRAGVCQGQVPDVWVSAGGRKQQGSGEVGARACFCCGQ